MPMKEGEILPQNREKYEEAIEAVALGGKPMYQIAEEIGISRTQFFAWLRRDDFKASVLERNVIAYKELIPPALKALRDSLNSKNERVKLDAAKTILERTMPDFNAEHGITPSQVLIQVNYA